MTTAAQTRARVINRTDNAITKVFIGGGPKPYITDGVARMLDFISLFFDEVTMRTFVDE